MGDSLREKPIPKQNLNFSKTVLYFRKEVLQVDIQLLKEFVSLARCLSFSEAAGENYISQPTLSKHISFLENLLQITLFKRDKRTVELTEGGRLFLEDAVRITEDYERALERVRMYRDGLAGELKIAYLENTRPNNFFACVKQFSEIRPNTKMTFHVFHDLGSIFEAVRDGKVDVGITVYAHDLDKAHLGYTKLRRIPICVCMQASDPLAEKDAVKITDMTGRKIYIGEENGYGGILESFMERCREKDAHPEIEFHTMGFSSVGLVELGQGLCFFIHGSEVPTSSTLTLVDFDLDEYSMELVAIWQPKNRNPEIKNFVNTLSMQTDETNKGEKA